MELNTQLRYRIGEWEFNSIAQTLKRSQQERPLSLKVALLLQHLTSVAPEPLTREQLIDLIWPESVVCDHTLSELVSQLRKALNDCTQPRQYVITIPKRGYRLVAAVKKVGTSYPIDIGAQYHHKPGN